MDRPTITVNMVIWLRLNQRRRFNLFLRHNQLQRLPFLRRNHNTITQRMQAMLSRQLFLLLRQLPLPTSTSPPLFPPPDTTPMDNQYKLPLQRHNPHQLRTGIIISRNLLYRLPPIRSTINLHTLDTPLINKHRRRL